MNKNLEKISGGSINLNLGKKTIMKDGYLEDDEINNKTIGGTVKENINKKELMITSGFEL